MASGSSTRPDRRARAAAAREAQLRAERRRRLLVVGGGALALVVILVAVIVVSIATRPKTTPTSAASAFAAPSDPVAGIQAAGLSLLQQEGQVLHIHAHLDVYVDGKPIVVPAGIGTAEGKGISPLHTHETDGIIHVESPVKKDYTLGQVFQEWQVQLTDSCLGNRCGGVDAYVNGKPVTGDPASIAIRAHDEIAVVSGQQPSKVPSRYDFPPGD